MGETITCSESKVTTTTNPQIVLDGMYYTDPDEEMAAKKAEADIMADLKAFHGIEAAPVLVGQPSIDLLGAVVGIGDDGKLVTVSNSSQNILGVIVKVDGDTAQVALSGSPSVTVEYKIQPKPKKILGVIKDPGNKAGKTMKEKLLAKPKGKDVETEIVDMLMEDTGE